ncbi:transcriptional activator Mut3p [Fusarium subglutinans]|uniref:Transcriptional activator Mut3p n=1 Tax=Gibberella subglutinans TaxID=42677 RepID=A0A8H5V127_GIBSU|nr:transcriptional activator Mut3p [Fusarium subglutinans]KAF5606631.1 transcriptional activator Mut3p [Fusarium subglutinans]
MFSPASDAHDRNPTYLEGLRLVNGNPLFGPQGQQWIKSRTGSTISPNIIDKYRLPYLCSTRPPLSNDNHKILKLPDRQIVEELAARFCSSPQSLVFPLLSLDCFMLRTLPLAYMSGTKRHATSAKCCAYGVLIMSDIFGLDSGDEMADIGSWCQRYALEIEGSIPTILREMRVDGLEALMMLMIFKYFMGDLESASFLVSVTSRFLIQLGAHLYPSPSDAYNIDHDAHHIRDLFWVCYCIDKDLSHRTGQPPTINDDHCDLTLPPNYVQMQTSNILSLSPCSSRSSSTVPLYPWDIRLSVMKSKIYNDLHSIGASRLSEAEILRRIRHRDEDLEAWRVTLPSDHRPTLSFLEQTPVDAHTNTQAIMLRLSYHHCVILIHQARCRVFQSDKPIDDLIDDGHRINFQILIDASRSILIYLEKALPVLAHECFWVIIFYPMTAILTIFSVALLDSRSDPENEKLKLLQGFTQLIRQIPIKRLTVAEISHLEFIEEVVEEMSRLVLLTP